MLTSRDVACRGGRTSLRVHIVSPAHTIAWARWLPLQFCNTRTTARLYSAGHEKREMAARDGRGDLEQAWANLQALLGAR